MINQLQQKITKNILKIMESLAGVVMKKRAETKKVSLGFNKDKEEDE